MESLLLYLILFFPGVLNPGLSGLVVPSGTIPFSLVRELGRTLTYTIPAFALLWYLMSDKKGFSALQEEKPKKRDLFSFSIGLPGLILIGFLVSLLVSLVSSGLGLVQPLGVDAPANITGWLVIAFSCLGTGYLEESYFRFYLLNADIPSWPENTVVKTVIRIGYSTFLFSLCHVYEGPGGILNALLAGVLLSILFIRYRSLHGIAWAHGAYNLFVYVMAAILNNA